MLNVSWSAKRVSQKVLPSEPSCIKLLSEYVLLYKFHGSDNTFFENPLWEEQINLATLLRKGMPILFLFPVCEETKALEEILVNR